MAANTQELDAVPDPRWELMEYLDAIGKKRADHQEIVAQRDRLRSFAKVEADALAKVDTLKQRDAKELAEQLVNPIDLHVTVDHGEQSEAECELTRAKREADAARACEPAVVERMTVSSQQITALEQYIPLLVADVMLDEAHALVAEINADAKRLRAKYAKLWGLRRHVGEAPAIRKRLENLPMPIHPDNVAPDLGELITAADAWRNYAARLAADPDAEFKE